MTEQELLSKMVAPGTKRPGKNGPITLNAAERKRFLGKFSKTGTCWVWTSGIFKSSGYGQFKLRGQPQQAHRVSFVIHKSDIPAGLLVLHRCDNRLCVNPDHLFLGSHQDNSDDMIAKCRDRCPKGEDHGMSTLTADQVEWVRRVYIPRHPKFGGSALSRSLGVKQQCISKVVTGVRWRDDR